MAVQLAEVADRLYALSPEHFTAARDAAVRHARQDGERDVAAAVKELRRPPVSAWAINLLARERSAQLEDLLSLGAELREAQLALAGAELRALSTRRHRVIASLTQQARELVQGAGHSLADAAAADVRATLEAALGDEAAAAAVRSGRLMRALSSTGLEPVDLAGAMAAPDDVRPVPARPLRSAARTNEDRHAELTAAQTSARDARSTLTRAGAELAAADVSLAAASDSAANARARVAELTEALAQAEADRSAADSEQRRAAKDRDTANRACEAAERAAQQADAALARLQKARSRK